MKRFAVVYLSTLIVLLPFDLLFLGAIGKSCRGQCRGHDVDDAEDGARDAVLRAYLAGVTVFVNGNPVSDWLHDLGYGALFGLFCYATFELTNMALLKHWEWAVVVPDVAEGAARASSASLGGLLADSIPAEIQ
jgi:uncharacterized membrane protein